VTITLVAATTVIVFTIYFVKKLTLSLQQFWFAEANEMFCWGIRIIFSVWSFVLVRFYENVPGWSQQISVVYTGIWRSLNIRNIFRELWCGDVRLRLSRLFSFDHKIDALQRKPLPSGGHMKETSRAMLIDFPWKRLNLVSLLIYRGRVTKFLSEIYICWWWWRILFSRRWRT